MPVPKPRPIRDEDFEEDPPRLSPERMDAAEALAAHIISNRGRASACQPRPSDGLPIEDAEELLRLYAPPVMLRGVPNDDGIVVAKVCSYEIVSDQDDEYIEITLKACVGSDLVWTGGNGLVSQARAGTASCTAATAR